MSDASVVLRVARASLKEFQEQFEALVPRYPKLQHLYVEHHGESKLPQPALLGAGPGSLCAVGNSVSGYMVFIRGRWSTLSMIGQRPIKTWESWYQGDGKLEFHSLAQRLDDQLEAFRVGVPPPSECLEVLRDDPALSEGMPVLPNNIQRWPRTLHWLAWAGEVMPVERYGHINGLDLPFDAWDESRFGPRPLTIFSLIDNLFLRSAAALEWIIASLERAHCSSEKVSDLDTKVPGPQTANIEAKPLRPSRETAYSQWKWAIRTNTAFCETTPDREVYDWLQDQDKVDDDRLPSFGTWSRYLREAAQSSE